MTTDAPLDGGDFKFELPPEIVSDIEPFEITKLGFDVNPEKAQKEAQTFMEMERKYKALVSELTLEEQLSLLGISFKQAFPPIDRDVEKLVVDVNVLVFKYMQTKMEQSDDVRVEAIRSTVHTALQKIIASMVSGDK